MDLGISGRIALVTAASRGLGYAVARRLSLEGVRVALCSRDHYRADAAAERIHDETEGEVIAYEADVTRPDVVRTLIANVIRDFGGLDILVCNAGGPPSGMVDDFKADDYRKAIELNLMSTIELCTAAYPSMRKNGWGRILCITSMAVKQPIDNLILSNTARAGTTGYAKSLSNQLAPFGVTVNCICPGYTRTERLDVLAEQFAESGHGSIDGYYSKIATSIPSGRVGDPDDFAQAAAFLCSEGASYITGVSLPVDGGAIKALF